MVNQLNSKFTKKDIIGCILVILSAFGGITIINYAEFYEAYNMIFAGVLLIWGTNIIFCLLDIKKRMILLLFHCTVFLFLISRPLIRMGRGMKWWTHFTAEHNVFAMRVVCYSMVALVAGVIIFELITKIRPIKEKAKERKTWVKKSSLIFVVRMALIVCMLCSFWVEIDKLLFMRGRAYAEFFLAYESNIPFFVTFPATCTTFLLCMLLALKPSKKEAFFWLALNIVLSMPALKIGVRNTFILNCIFAFVYYYLRDVIREENEKKWIGKYEKLLVISVIPMMIIFLGAYNYIRAGESVELSMSELVVDFAYNQGTTYDTVLQGYAYEEELPWKDEQIYTFGAIVDASYNFITTKLFDLEDLGNGNGLKAVYNGHSFAHAISYLALGKNYIAGEGRGSTYVIENYIDWGYPGVVCFSIFLGMLCSYIPHQFGKKCLSSIVILNILTKFFFTPRSESLAFATFFVSYKFWGCILGCIILAKVWEVFLNRINLRKIGA